MRLVLFSFMGGLAWTVICVARIAWLNRISRDATSRVRRSLPLIHQPTSTHNTVSPRLPSLPTGSDFKTRPALFFVLFKLNGGLK